MGFEDTAGMRDTVVSIAEAYPKLAIAGSALLCYTLLCRALRYQRVRRMRSKYPYKTRDDMAHMTGEEAFEIQRDLMEAEFPFTTNKALQFALFRTYGIPTISKLLVQTKQLSSKEHAPRVCTSPFFTSDIADISPSATSTPKS